VPSGTAPDETARVRYTEGQFLGAVDFADEQIYHRDELRRHEIGQHTWGIVDGLDLTEVADPSDAQFVEVVLNPGTAVDGYGRRLVVYSPVRLGAGLFDAFTDDAHRSVWITYDETTDGTPGDGFNSCQEDQPTRTIETWDIRIDPAVTDHVITVDGLDVVPAPAPTGKLVGPDDTSVPEQELPSDDPVTPWVIRLGTVHWDGSVQRLRPAAAGRLGEQRRYAGVVADHVLAPTPALRIAPRTAPTDVDAAEFAVVEGRLEVEGRLTAEREVWLEGHPARFTYDGGAEDNVAITLGRQHGSGGVGDQLRLKLGDDSSATGTTFSIGAADGGSATTTMELGADGTVSVPSGHLTFGTTTRQEIDLGGGVHGIGTQAGVTYLRSDQEFAWFKGGSHVDTVRDPGPGGQLQLRLDGDGSLDFGARTRQMIDLWAVDPTHNYGIGVQPCTLYFRTDYDVCWFRGGAHVDVRDSPGGGGVLAMRLDDSSHLEVFGALSCTSDMTVGEGGDAVLHTRHVFGKGSGNDNVDDLYLNWNNGKRVVVGDPSGSHSDLVVSGALSVPGGSVDSVIKVETFNETVSDSGSGPGNWSVTWVGTFDSVEAVVASLDGFSITSEIGVASPSVFEDTAAIPQHVWVTVDSWDVNGATGRAFLGQSDATQNANNDVSFTLLVIGRKWT
jgi:hypothetical protein